jgi:hypothetical protein
MSVPDVLSVIKSNLEYGSLNSYEDLRSYNRKRGSIQVDEDADIYFGYYEQSDNQNEEE